MTVRLDRLLSTSGISRAEARLAIRAGRVRVNGEVVRDAGAHAEAGDVLVDGRPLELPGELYLMLNKPAGVVTAARDNVSDTVFSLLPDAIRRRDPSPVGRLDKDVTGLLLFTTDGELLHRLISPKRTVEKVYLASVEGTPDAGDARVFAEGVPLSDFTAKPSKLEVVGDGLALATVTEGKFHQVKRMFAAIGHPVVSLTRLSVGGVTLDPSLPEGGFRMLEESEVSALYAVAGLERK
jgi:16S rRNA pseudouridine516 synthase